MNQTSAKSGFTLIRSPKRKDVDEVLSKGLPIQRALFPALSKDLLIFVAFPRVTEHEFLRALEMGQPQVVLDLRRFPRFDIGSLNRQKVFQAFINLGLRYVDFAWQYDTNVGEEIIYPNLGVDRTLDITGGTVMILIEEQRRSHQLIETITEQFGIANSGIWDVMVIPDFQDSDQSLNLAFG